MSITKMMMSTIMTQPLSIRPFRKRISEADGNGRVIRHDVREDKRDENAPGTSSGESAANNGKGTGRKPVPFSAADAVIIGTKLFAAASVVFHGRGAHQSRDR